MQLSIRRYELARAGERRPYSLFLALLAALAVAVAFLGMGDRSGAADAPSAIELGP